MNQHFDVPPFISINDVTPAGVVEPEYVLTNEATGKFYKVNRATVQFLDGLRRTGSVPAALQQAQISPALANGFLAPLLQAGVLVVPGETQSAPAPKAPLEGKLISLRADLWNAGPFVASVGVLGRLLYGPLGYLAWGLAVIAAIYNLITHADKVALGLRSIPDMGWAGALVFAVLYVFVKVVHELGHALAYRQFCLRNGIEPGPIRVGISVFAMTPFPFTDVSGAWRLRSRFERAMIGAGGLYFETWMIALLTLFWANTQTGPVQTIILQVAIVAGFITMFFNLNPAVKLDGYYVLTDLIRRPNLAARASIAARNLVVRLLGGQGEVDRFDLGYWAIAYLYRWSIFVGIFWLSYQFDPLLSPVVLAITVMMLVVRPMMATIRHVRKQKVRPWRSAAMAGGLALLAIGLFLPLPDRLLLRGNLETMDTRFVEPNEPGLLLRSHGDLALRNPELRHQLTDATLRAQIIANSARSVGATARERASLAQDVHQLTELSAQLQRRLDALEFAWPQAAVWTPLDGAQYEGAWLARAATAIGAVSIPKPAELKLTLNQKVLERDLDLSGDTLVSVRLVHDADCQMEARLQPQTSDFFAFGGEIRISASPVDLPVCAQGLPSGSAVVARLGTPAKSLIERSRIAMSRLLQDRLPVNLN